MASPKIKFKRSAVAGKRPTLNNLELGEIALNTFDGKLFSIQDTGGVGIATTVYTINPWNEDFGGGTIRYSGDVTVTGIVSATSFSGDGSTLSSIPTSIVAGDNISVSGSTGAVTITGLANTSNVSTNTLVVSGITTLGGNLNLGDNDKINLGAGNDLQIYHDDTHSYIDDAGTGNLRLRSGVLEITNLAGSKTSAQFSSGSGQELYFNNSKKFETTTSGVTITGTVSATAFSGDGSALTNIGIATAIVSSDLNQTGIITATSQFYPPTLTTTQRDAISFNNGAMIFNTDEQKVQVYIVNSWKTIAFELDPYTIVGL